MSQPALTQENTRGYGFGVLAALLAGTALRLAYAYDRPFIGDEVGSLQAMGWTYRELLTKFGGWQTMNFYLAAVKALFELCGEHRAAMAVPSLIAGIGTIALAASVGRRLISPAGGVLTAWLVATNPFLIRFSGIVRAYSLLAAFCTAGLVAWLRWRDRPTWGRGWLLAILLAGALLVHLNAAFYILALAALTVWSTAEWRRTEGDRLAAMRAMTLLVPCVVALSVVTLAYLPQWDDIGQFRSEWSSEAPSSVAYIAQVYSMYMGGNWAVLVTLLLLLVGVAWAIRAGGVRLVPMLVIILCMAFVSLAGVSHHAAAFARFSIPLLPLLLLLLAAGVLALRRRLAVFIVLLVLAGQVSAELTALYREKAASPWQQVARYILEQKDLGAVVPVGYAADAVTANSPEPIEFTMARDLPAVSAGPSGQLRVLLVDEMGVLAARKGARQFGDVTLLVYAGASGREVAEKILLDLEQALGDRPHGQRTGYYEAGFQLASALGHHDAYTRWREGYWNSYRRSPAVRNARSKATDWPEYR